MKNRLQFNYYMPEVFPYTREDAVAFIESLFSTNSMESLCSLTAEPIIVFYGETSSTSSALIAIGRGGNGVDKPNNLPYYLVDYTKSVEDISFLLDKTSKLNGEVDKLNEVISEINNNITGIKENATRIEVELNAKIDEVDGRLNEKIDGETKRAESVEELISDNLNAEITRAKNKESEILSSIDNTNEKLAIAQKNITTNKVKSENRSITITPIDNVGTDISINVDDKSIVIDKTTGQIKVDSSVIRQPISSDDMILTNGENGLYAHLSMAWVKSTDGSAVDEIQLIGRNGIVISRINVADFIKDGILNGVKLETRDGQPYLIFTFNTGEVIELDVKELIDVYVAGDGIQIIDNVVSIKRDPTSDNFLSVSPDGLKISGIQSAIDNANMGLTNAITSVDAKVDVLNGNLETPGSVKHILSQTIIANEVTNITPESISGQTLLRRVATSGSIYASNRAIDIIYEAEDGNTSNINILIRNLLTENAVLKEKVNKLESVEYKEQLFTEFANRIYNGITGAAMEIGVNKKYDSTNTNINGVEIGFADDALFQAGV